MKKLILFSLLILGMISSSCKKKDNTTSGGGSSTSTSGFTNVYGTMISEQVLTYYPSLSRVDTSYSALAWFFNTPQNNWIFNHPNLTTPAGNVFLNSTKLQEILSIPGYILYVDSTYTLNLKNNNSWQVSGASPIPALAFSPAILWPSYTGYTSLHDTIHKAQDNTITLNGITGADSVSINIDDGSNISGHSYTTGRVTSGTSSITVLAAHTSGLNNTANGTLTISLFKFAPVAYSGKNFIFIKDVEFKKIVEIDNY